MLLLPNTKKQLINWIVAIAIPAIVIPLVACLSDYGLSNTFAIVGVIYLAYVVLWAVQRAGAFDVFTYQFTNWTSTTFRKGSPKRYEDLYDYRDQKKVKRQANKPAWLPYIIIGAALVVTAIIIAVVQQYINPPADPNAEEVTALISSISN